MRDELAEVLDLQPEWTHKNSPAMQRRGELVRHVGPEWLRTFAPQLAAAMGIHLDDLIIQGRDGTGPKTEVPWFRFGSRSRSPSATTDWYCVYLFDTRGETVYLSLAHGATVWDGVDFRPRPADDLRALGRWARQTLGPAAHAPDLTASIRLHSRRSDLGPSYEAGTGVAKAYRRTGLPSDLELQVDALRFAELLGIIYSAAQSDLLPLGPAPEVLEALEAADRTAGRPPSGKGQGFRPNKEQRLAIEQYAMDQARSFLIAWGWTLIKDESGRKPFDFYCSDGDNELYVEVKGTTSNGERVILTHGEVVHHRSVYPHNALIVVSDIVLGGPERTIATGGTIRCRSPWIIPPEDLAVVSYIYDVHPDGSEVV